MNQFKWAGYVCFCLMIGFVCLQLGVKGFTSRGLPVTGCRFIVGAYAKLIAVVVLAFGLLMLFLGISLLIHPL